MWLERTWPPSRVTGGRQVQRDRRGGRKVGWPRRAILEGQSVGAWLPGGAAWVSHTAYPGVTECLGSHWGCLLTE